MSAQELPVYVIGMLRVKDQQDYIERYGLPVFEQLNTIGAETVSVTAAPQVLEGEWDFNWLVLIRFPSKAVASEWYNSPEYAPFQALRANDLTNGGLLILSETFDLANFVPT